MSLQVQTDSRSHGSHSPDARRTSATGSTGSTDKPGDAILRSGRSLLSRVTHGVLLAQEGMFEETVALLADTHHRLRNHPVSESAPVMPGVLVNLGLAQTLCGRFAQAEDLLCEAWSLAEERGLSLMAMVVRQNLGCLSLYRGDTSSAIATFHDLAPRLPSERREALHVDLAEALLSEGLVEEAASTLADGPWSDGRSSMASTLLVEAKLRLLGGDHQHAAELSNRVRHVFGSGSLWYGLATRLAKMALRDARVRPLTPVTRARSALAARVPLAVPGPRERTAPHRALDAMARTASFSPGPWLAGADKDPHVVQAGLERALDAGKCAAALEWAELARTWAVPRVPGPRVHTPEMASLTDRYRDAQFHGQGSNAIAREWESARWHAHHGARAALSAEATQNAQVTQATQATQTAQAPAVSLPSKNTCVSETVHTSRSTGPGGASASQRPADREPVTGLLLERLGERAFVRYTRAEGEAVALVAVAGRVHSRVLGPLPVVARALARFVHQRFVPGHADREAADSAARALLGPVLPLVGDRPLVVASDPYLGDPPWGMLPALRGRPLSLVPTARFWLDRPALQSAAPARTERVLLVAAPEPGGARREVVGLAALHPRARVLTADRARRRDVLAGFGDADLVHLAGHGRVPDRSPMLASVDLHDGPLLACDLADLSDAPDVVTLSTCWSGRDFAGRTGAPLGFAGALLAAGARAVVASPVPVGDSGTGEAMRRFHRALTAGTPVPEAVALHLGQDGFCCFGG